MSEKNAKLIRQYAREIRGDAKALIAQYKQMGEVGREAFRAQMLQKLSSKRTTTQAPVSMKKAS